MIGVLAVTVLAVAALLVLADAMRRREHTHERKEQSWGRERQQLLDRVMYLADKPWQIPEPPSFPTPEAPEPLIYPDLEPID